MNDELLLTCDCDGLGHVIQFACYERNEAVYVTFLSQPRSFWERVTGLFRRTRAVHDVVLSPVKAMELANWLDEKLWPDGPPPEVH